MAPQRSNLNHGDEDAERHNCDIRYRFDAKNLSIDDVKGARRFLINILNVGHFDCFILGCCRYSIMKLILNLAHNKGLP